MKTPPGPFDEANRLLIHPSPRFAFRSPASINGAVIAFAVALGCFCGGLPARSAQYIFGDTPGDLQRNILLYRQQQLTIPQTPSVVVVPESSESAEERAIARQSVIEAYKARSELERTKLELNAKFEAEKRAEWLRRGEAGRVKLNPPGKAAPIAKRTSIKLPPIAVLECESGSYEQVRLLYVVGDDVVFMHAKGGGKLKLAQLPDDVRTNILSVPMAKGD